MQNFDVLYAYVLIHALPGIVDGARKKSQGGSWIWVGASVPILEATTSRNQCMSAVTSTVSCIMVLKQAVRSAERNEYRDLTQDAQGH